MNTTDSSAGDPEASLASGIEAELTQYLLAQNPSNLVLIGQPPGAQCCSQHAEQTPGLQLMPFDTLEQCLAELPLVEDDAAVTASGNCVALMELGQPDSLDVATILGQAVHRFPERLVVSIDRNEPNDAAFFAFGFRRLQLEGQGSIRLFEYCLSEYKQAPDWLNARNWANPERFGLDGDQNYYSEDDDDDDEEE